jgi:triacylglycerol lipase
LEGDTLPASAPHKRNAADATPKPTSTPDTSISQIDSPLGSTIALPFSSNTPSTPIEPTTPWTALALARRELENVAAIKTLANRTVTLPSNSLVTPTPATTPSVTRGILADAQPVAASVDTQSLYTGQPSFVARLVTLGLRLVTAVLKPFGITSIESLAAIQVPIFTDGKPPFFLTTGLDVQRTEFDGMPVYTLRQPGSTSEKEIIALHGGAYVGQISIFHWWTYADIARDTGATVVVPIYPVAPAGTAAVVVPKTADLISQAIADRGADNVSVLGDSAGGGLALAAMQELVRRGSATPGRMVLLAPWLDATLSDPASQTIPDPLLDVASLRKDGLLWAGNLDPADPLVSPINGSLSGLPPTYIYSGSLDLLSPETLRLREAAIAQGLTNFTFILRKGEIHDWPTFPFLTDAVDVRPAIESQLLGTDTGNVA